jgi:hypothetical protein
MTVSVEKKPVILVVHGVQLGEDQNLQQDRYIKELVQSRLAGHAFEFEVDLYCYENLNDSAQQKLKQLSKLIIQSPISSILATSALDIVGDVVISLSKNSTANEIRDKLKEKILHYFELGNPLYLLAHSLGSVYCFDVLNELMSQPDYFKRDDPLCWPVQGILTIGSPLGLTLFKQTGRDKAAMLGLGEYNFKWLNYFDVNDPIVSGSLFGTALESTTVAEQFKQNLPDFGWYIQDYPVVTGKTWLLAHTAYWQNPMVGDGLVNMMV